MIKAIGELNGLGEALRSIIESNMRDPKVRMVAEKLKCSAVIKTDYGISITLFINHGDLSIQSDPISSPDVLMEGGFETLAKVCTRKENVFFALLRRRIKIKGLRKALKLRKVIILSREIAKSL
jgi:putative sterol carrier protein